MEALALNTVQRCAPQTLTLKEIEILRLSASGKTAANIALILRMKERTVRFHVASAVQKMGVPNKTAAVVQAVLKGMF